VTESLLSELPPLSLYIHIPWCVRKCPYCDFNSHTADNIPEQEYIAALVADLEQELEYVQGRTLNSIFFGGGTPSLFSAAGIDAILQAVAQRIVFSTDIEITLEANPGTVEQKKFSGYRAAGINRLSIGVQSFQRPQLQALGRIHSSQEAIHAAHAAIKAGIHNFNLDLMHGLPGQTLPAALEDLQQAIDLQPTHISWYQLTVEPNTAFYQHPPTLPAEELMADIQSAGEERLAQHQYQQYEISAYSQANRQAKHNLNYWLFGDYIGIGAGAHGKITQLQAPSIHRRWKTRAPHDYLNSDTAFLAGKRTLTTEELPLEFLMNSLRLNAGFKKTDFTLKTGLPIESISERLATLMHRGLLMDDHTVIKTTALGRQFLNNILVEF
jgi:oxygen-independent coproporphyrinogen-3 oxidase